MWTPRRLLLLVFGFVLCIGAYEAYSFLLGHYDGLPPLPPEYRTVVKSDGKDIPDPEKEQESRQHEIVKLLEKAFGPKCIERDRKKKLETGDAKNRKVFAFDEYKFVDGRLRLQNISLAIFTLHPAENNEPEGREEIVTLRGEVAWVKFNQPVSDLWEIKKGVKPVAGYVEGKEIIITHNRGTPNPDDDIIAFCEQRIDFVDDQHRVWSEGKVRVIVANPPEARFEGYGLTILLTSDLLSRAEPGKKTGPPSDGLNLGTVKSVRLDHDVEFTFLKLQGSFLSGNVGSETAKSKPTPKAAEAKPNQPMVISCKDAFEFDVVQSTATFNTNVHGLRSHIETTPEGPRQSYDELDADDKLVLILQPPPKDNKPKNPEEEAQKYELKRAIATGKIVKITANEGATKTGSGKSQGLQAIGVELICDNVTHEATMRGAPQVVAWMQDYNIVTPAVVKIFLPEPTDTEKEIKGLKIEGPGEVKVRPTVDHPDPYPLANWQRELQWHRTGIEHRVELYGSAVFMDEKQGRMAGEQLKVWMTAEEKKPEASSKKQEEKLDLNASNSPLPAPSGNLQNSLNGKLKRVEAEGAVSILSPRLVVPQAQKLFLNFIGAPEGFIPQRLPDQEGATPLAQPTTVDRSVQGNNAPSSAAPPLYLDAAVIDGDILMAGNNPIAIRRLHAEEKVHIERRPDQDKRNGLDIRGQRLEMNLIGASELYRFKLFGAHSTVKTEKFTLEGDQLEIDQAENTATVPGPGKFTFLTQRTFQGAVIEGEPEKVVFNWDEQMNFGGKVAVFQGNVQAEQEKQGVTVSCQKLVATLDRTINLSARERDPQRQNASLESVICSSPNNKVVIEQRIYPNTPKWRHVRVEGVQVVFDNMQQGQEVIRVFGPGEVNLVRIGGDPFQAALTPGQPANAPPKVAAQPPRLMLTRVLFGKEAVYRKSSGSFNFWENVRIFYLPGDNIAMVLDEKKLGKEGIFLASNQLQLDQQGTNDQATHLVEANGNVELRANQDRYAKGDRATFDEAKGKAWIMGKPAKLYQQDRPGAPYQQTSADAYEYDKNTGEFKAINSRGIQVK
jgi:hypothetical protein